MKKIGRAFVGEWRITEMEAWDADYLNMEVPAHITIRKDLSTIFSSVWCRGNWMGGWKPWMARTLRFLVGRFRRERPDEWTRLAAAQG
ncbi:hypothetical protein [Aromatoleum aromaticum]|uniref:hypothetical protein n=1 Tax=Aromatoleum aromaticum TaxID=551760 RepID=UPI0002F32074|nr:hypothetical protein [Aromatoleum aromaticum]